MKLRVLQIKLKLISDQEGLHPASLPALPAVTLSVTFY